MRCISFFFPTSCVAAASVPASETESVNTENQNGEDEKTPCCGPLWWECTILCVASLSEKHGRSPYFKSPCCPFSLSHSGRILPLLPSLLFSLGLKQTIPFYFSSVPHSVMILNVYVLTTQCSAHNSATSFIWTNSSFFQSKNFKVKVQVSIFVGLCLCMMCIIYKCIRMYMWFGSYLTVFEC